MEKKEALRVFREAENKYKHLILSIPISLKRGEIVPAQIHYSNPYEAHKSDWLFAELEKMFDWKKIILSCEMGIFMK
jgi:hypothetical protein